MYYNVKDECKAIREAMRAIECRSKMKYHPGDVFVLYSKLSRDTIKKYLVWLNTVGPESLILYCCEICGNIGWWNMKRLTLDMDHKDGCNWDNRLFNLRFLCPNCHKQMDTSNRNKLTPAERKILKSFGIFVREYPYFCILKRKRVEQGFEGYNITEIDVIAYLEKKKFFADKGEWSLSEESNPGIATYKIAAVPLSH
jgi:hypothetical protein